MALIPTAPFKLLGFEAQLNPLGTTFSAGASLGLRAGESLLARAGSALRTLPKWGKTATYVGAGAGAAYTITHREEVFGGIGEFVGGAASDLAGGAARGLTSNVAGLALIGAAAAYAISRRQK